MEVFSVDATVETDQVARLKAVRARRDGSAATKALDDVERAAKTEANLMPPILAAVSAYVTLGEISDRLRKVFGEYRSS